MAHEQRKFTIGRNPACDLSLADDTVSDRHAELSFIGQGKILLTDTRSSNGTFVVRGGGEVERIRQALVSPLDQVRFGNMTLTMRDLLEALRMKFPRFDEFYNQPAPAAPRPRVEGSRLVRCECGTIVRSEDSSCPGCGR